MRWENIQQGAYKHVVDTTAILSVSTPIMASVEKLAGFSTDMSIRAREAAACLGAAGYFFLISKGRQITEKLFPNTNKSWRDSLYFGSAGILSLPLIYQPTKYLAEKLDVVPPENWNFYTSTAAACAVGFTVGRFMGYSVDIFRDLTEIKESERSLPPKNIKKLHPKIKQGIALGLMGLSVLATNAIYKCTDYLRDNSEHSSQSQLEDILD